MQRFALSLLATTALVTGGLSSTAAASEIPDFSQQQDDKTGVDFDKLREENRDKENTDETGVDFDQLREENRNKNRTV